MVTFRANLGELQFARERTDYTNILNMNIIHSEAES